MRIFNINIRSSIILTIGLGILSLFALWVIARAWVYFNTGASKKDILMVEEQYFSDHTPQFFWIDNDNEGREIEDYLKARIKNDYGNAWYFNNLQHKNGYSSNAELFYTKENIKHQKELLTPIASDNQIIKKRIERVDLEHKIDFHLYSLDGQIIAFTDSAAVVVEEIFDEQDNLIHTRKFNGVYDVVMIYQDENWHIKHIVPQEIKDYESSFVEKDSKSDNFIYLTDNHQFVNQNEVFFPRGVNYYPKEFPWEMWDSFDMEIIQRDLEIMDSLQFNTVRIFLGFEEFGKGRVDYQYLEYVKYFLDEAEKNSIKVIPTLFDFVNNYQLSNWSATDRQIEIILSRFKDHPAILAWDLKNEPNLDFKHHGKENVLAWLEFMLERMRMYDPNHLITIGWSNPEEAHYLSDLQDFVTFHYYESTDLLADKIDELQAQVQKPLMLGEFGLSTYNSFLFPGGCTETEQAAKYHDILQILQEKRDMAFITWTLHDFESVPSKVVGSLPWRKNPQRQFGILDLDGNPKMAAQVLDPDYDFSQPIQIPLMERLLKPFYITLILGTFFAILALIAFWKRKVILKSKLFRIITVKA